MPFLPHRKIPIWENKRRTQLLRTFRNLVVKHDDELFHNTTFGEHAETDASRATRTEINLILDEVDRVIDLTGLATTVTWTPPPMIGGYVQRIPVVTNLFRLDDFQIPYQAVLDFVDRAIGIHERDRSAAWVRTFNPLF